MIINKAYPNSMKIVGIHFKYEFRKDPYKPNQMTLWAKVAKGFAYALISGDMFPSQFKIHSKDWRRYAKIIEHHDYWEIVYLTNDLEPIDN